MKLLSSPAFRAALVPVAGFAGGICAILFPVVYRAFCDGFLPVVS